MKISLLLLLTIISTSSYAGLMTFSDRVSFDAATSASLVGALPANANASLFSVGALTFTREGSSTLNTSRNWSTLISEPFDLAINSTEHFNVDSAVDIFSFGFDFHEPSVASPSSPDTCNATCIDSTFEVSLLNGAVAVGDFQFIRPNASLEFVGVLSTEAFNRIEIREIVGSIDNEFFGNFSIGRVASIPEPSIVALFATGFFGMGVARRKMRR